MPYVARFSSRGARPSPAFVWLYGAISEPLGAYAAKVRDQSYRITDDEVAGLTAAGLSDDVIFEITIAAAVGAALERLDAGMRAVRGSA